MKWQKCIISRQRWTVENEQKIFSLFNYQRRWWGEVGGSFYILLETFENDKDDFFFFFSFSSNFLIDKNVKAKERERRAPVESPPPCWYRHRKKGNEKLIFQLPSEEPR